MILQILSVLLLQAIPDPAPDSTSEGAIQGPGDIIELFSFSKILLIIFTLAVGYFILRLLKWALEFFAEKSTRHRITIKGFIPIIQIFGWVAIIFFTVNTIIRPPIETIITISASLGLAVGFASQDILKNIFGGVVIILDNPFQVGDKIEVGSYYGEVKSIGLRSTKIVTPDDSLVSVPNSEVVNNSVSNSNTGESNCQVVAEIYLPIDIDTDKVRELATQAAQVSRYIYLNKPVAVLFFNEVKERKPYMKMRLKAYVSDIRDEFMFKSDLTELVIRELVKEKIITKDFIQG